MGCCNVRTLSYISASFQLVLWVLVIILLIIGAVQINVVEYDDRKFPLAIAQLVIVLLFILSLLAIIKLIILLVGLKKKSLPLINIYVVMNYGFLSVSIVFLIYELISDIINESGIGTIFFNIFINLLVLGFFLILFTPIIIYHRRMRSEMILPTTYNGHQRPAASPAAAYPKY